MAKEPVVVIRKEDVQYLDFVKKPKNKLLQIQALTKVCLAGEVNRDRLNEVIESMDEIDAKRFIILFKSSFGRQDFKAIYAIETKQ